MYNDFCSDFILEKTYKTSQLAVYTFGLWDSNFLIKHFSTRIQWFVLKKHVVSTKLSSVYLCKYA